MSQSSISVGLGTQRGFMKKIWLSIGLFLLLALSAFAEDKEAERVENAGKS